MACSSPPTIGDEVGVHVGFACNQPPLGQFMDRIGALIPLAA
jgi:hypothetical protein